MASKEVSVDCAFDGLRYCVLGTKSKTKSWPACADQNKQKYGDDAITGISV